jgi:Arc/MetJ-type ribon-helix-helix transcriptional regulator
MTGKVRLSATVDDEFVETARRAVSDGRAESVSAWVNDALARQAAHDRRLQALDEFIDEYEAEHGVISDEEMREARRRVSSRARVVRGRRA